MEYPDVIIKIIENNECPLYALGDEFNISGNALMLPPEKPVCMIFVKDISTQFGHKGERQPDETFSCSGCTGKIRLECRESARSGIQRQPRTRDETIAIANLLGNFSLFRDLAVESIEEIVSFLKLRNFTENEIVIRKGTPGRHLFIIISGRVEILDDQEMNIAFLGSGEVFGEMSLLSGEPVGATVRAQESTKVLFINSRDFRQILNRFPGLQMFFAKLLARRLASTNIARVAEVSSGMIGRLSEMLPAELFHTLNSNQKTGVLVLELARGKAKISFREGELVRCRYLSLEGVNAFFAVLREKKGQFRFMPGLSEEDLKADPLGDFMWLMMEGVRKMDEEEEG